MSEQASATGKRFRREPGVGRQLILKAAHDEFCERGFSRTTTRSIAERAGVVEPLLFRNFGSKAGLFTEVVVAPFRDFLHEWEELQDSSDDEYPDENTSRLFVTGLYDLLREHRGLVITYLATQAFEPEVLENRADGPAFAEVLQILDRARDRYGKRPSSRRLQRQFRLHERLNLGSVIAAALFDNLVFSELSRSPTREEIIDELARIAVVSLPQPAG